MRLCAPFFNFLQVLYVHIHMYLFSLLLSGESFEQFIARSDAVGVAGGTRQKCRINLSDLPNFVERRSTKSQVHVKQSSMGTICLWLEHNLPVSDKFEAGSRDTSSNCFCPNQIELIPPALGIYFRAIFPFHLSVFELKESQRRITNKELYFHVFNQAK